MQTNAVRYDKIPVEIKYRDALQSSADHIVSVRKLSIVPQTGGSGYRPSTQNTFTFYIDDVSQGAALKCSSVYMTAKIKAYKAGVATDTAKFASSCSDLINRVTIRSKKSRVVLADIRNFGTYAALVDKLRMSDDMKQTTFARGFTEASEFESLYKSGKDTADELKLGNQNFLFDLSVVPFFGSQKLYWPVASSGGLEVTFTLERAATGLLTYNNADAGLVGAAADDYEISDARLHVEYHYMSEALQSAIDANIKKNGVDIPYSSVINVTHRPTSENENIRLSSSLSHLSAVFCVHKHNADISDIDKNSISHFGNPQCQSLQISCGGILVPNLALTVATDEGKKVSADLLMEIKSVMGEIGAGKISKDALNKKRVNKLLASSVTAARENWDAGHVIGLRTDSGSRFSSLFNRQSSSPAVNQSGADITASLKYAVSPSASHIDFFLLHQNTARILPGGRVVPSQMQF